MAVEAPNIFVTILAFVTLIGTLVVVHELGHYNVPRLSVQPKICGPKPIENFSAFTPNQRPTE